MRNQRLRNGEETDLDGRDPKSHRFTLADGARPDVPVMLAALEPKVPEFGAWLDDRVLLDRTTPEHARYTTERVDVAAAGRTTTAIGAHVRISAKPDATEQAQAHPDFDRQLPAYRGSLLRMGFTAGDSLTGDDAEASILYCEAEPTVGRFWAWFPLGIDAFIRYPIGDGPGQWGIDLGREVVHRLAGHRA